MSMLYLFSCAATSAVQRAGRSESAESINVRTFHVAKQACRGYGYVAGDAFSEGAITHGWVENVYNGRSLVKAPVLACAPSVVSETHEAPRGGPLLEQRKEFLGIL